MSTAVATKTQYTPEDLLAMPDGKRYELVGGQLVERNTGLESSWVGGRLHSRLDRFCEEHDVGWALPADDGYQCFPHDPRLVRRPDVSFIRRGRLPNELLPSGWGKIPPDLAVEVVSPNDSADLLEEKLDDYQKVAVPLVWVVNLKSLSPSSRRSTALTARSAACERATSSRARMSYPAFGVLCGISFHRAKRSYRARPHQTGLIRKINNDPRQG